MGSVRSRVLGSAGLLVLTAGAAVSAVKWSVAGKKAIELPGLQYSADAMITCRVVSFRSKFASLNPWGAVKAYPVVRAPSGRQYSGFARQYEAGALADNWIRWTFPTQFRSPTTKVEVEQDAQFGDSLSDGLGNGGLPAGTYQVKWVFNDKVLDNGDTFFYAYRELRK
jgi:hypothetical protein